MTIQTRTSASDMMGVAVGGEVETAEEERAMAARSTSDEVLVKTDRGRPEWRNPLTLGLERILAHLEGGLPVFLRDRIGGAPSRFGIRRGC